MLYSRDVHACRWRQQQAESGKGPTRRQTVPAAVAQHMAQPVMSNCWLLLDS